MSVREKVLADARVPKKPQPVETIFGTVYVRKLESREWAKFRDETLDKPDAAQLVDIAVDEFGTPIFTDKDVPELERVDMQFGTALTRKFNEVNGLLSPKASAPTAASPSASPPTSDTPT